MGESRLSYGRVFRFLVLAITFVAALGWQMSAPVCSDDWVYLLAAPSEGYSDYSFWHAEGEAYETAGQVWETIAGHARMSTARLTNLIYIPVQLLPHGVLKFICGLLVWLMFVGLMALSVPRVWRMRPGLLMTAVFMFWFIFPWYDSMQSSAYIFNYPLVTVVMAVWLWLYRRIGNACASKRAFFAVFTLIVSLFHEGFTIPLGCYVFTAVALGPKSERGYGFFMVLLMITGVGLEVALGTGERVAGYTITIEGIIRNVRWTKVKILTSMLPCIVALGAIVYARLFVRRIPREEFTGFLFPCAGGMIGGFLMCFALSFFSRATWPAEVFAFLSIMRLAGYLRVRRVLVQRMVRVAGVLFIGVYCAWVYELVRWQRLSSAGQEAVVRALYPRGSRGCDVVYAQVVHADDIPFYLMDMAAPVEEVQRFNNRTLALYWTRRGVDGLLVLPEWMEGIATDSIRPIAGNAHFRGEYPYLFTDKPYKGHIVVRAGEYRGGYNPLMRLARRVTPRLFGGEDVVAYPYVESEEVMMPDSSVRYMVLPECGPRTFRYREILSVDTIDGGR